jgi:hypothetical protein
MSLSSSQIRGFHVNGFLSIEDPIASSEELRWLRETYDRMFEARSGRQEGNQFDLAGSDEEGKEAALPQILDPTRYAPELMEGQFLTKATQIVKELLGEDASLGIAHAIFKPAGHGAATPWHQDEAYWDPEMLQRFRMDATSRGDA